MSANGPALIAAAAGVGFGHAVLPDHWVPLAVLGRTRRYPPGRIARLSGLAGVAHVLVSIVLGGVVIAIGLQFRSAIQSAQDAIVGSLLIATGAGFALLELLGAGHGHTHADGHTHAQVHTHPPDHTHPHEHPPPSESYGPSTVHPRGQPEAAPARTRIRSLAAVMVPFGATASPDLTILPVFLASATVGAATALASLAIFALVTIGTIVGLTLVAARGGYELRGQWVERWGNVLTALVLVLIGGLVITGVV
jgi:nickel/cobalt exporter